MVLRPVSNPWNLVPGPFRRMLSGICANQSYHAIGPPEYEKRLFDEEWYTSKDLPRIRILDIRLNAPNKTVTLSFEAALIGSGALT